MNLLISTQSFYERYGEDEKGFQMIREAGFDGVDYDYYPQIAPELLGEDYCEKAYKTRKLLDENNLVCTLAHAPIFQMYGLKLDDSEIKWKQLTRSIEAASILGAKQIVVHATRVPDGVDDLEHTVKYYKRFEPFCQKHNIQIAIENIGRWDEKRQCTIARYGTPEDLYKLLELLDSPWYVVCVDVGHAAYSVGPEPEELIEKLDNRILRCLHIHDNDYKWDAHALPYTGNLNWERITAALGKIQYEGDFTLETITYLRKFDEEMTLEALKFAEKVGRHLIKKLEAVHGKRY